MPHSVGTCIQRRSGRTTWPPERNCFACSPLTPARRACQTSCSVWPLLMASSISPSSQPSSRALSRASSGISTFVDCCRAILANSPGVDMEHLTPGEWEHGPGHQTGAVTCALFGIDELREEGANALAAIAETGDFEPVEVLVDLALAKDQELLHAFVELVDAAAEQDAEGFEHGREGD